MYVLAMNRLRAAHVELDPEVDRALVASRFDDRDGLAQTYFFLRPKRRASQFLGSSMMFIIAVNSALCGLLAAAVAGVSGLVGPVLITVGVIVCIAYAAGSALLGGPRFQNLWVDYVPLHPSPGERVSDPGQRSRVLTTQLAISRRGHLNVPVASGVQ